MSLRDSVPGLAAMAVWSLGAFLLLAAGSPPLQAPDPPPEPGTVGVESFEIPNLGGWSITSNGTETETQGGLWAHPRGGGFDHAFRNRHHWVQSGRDAHFRSGGSGIRTGPGQGRIFAEVNARVNTGLAIANPNDAPATIDFYFTGIEGERFGEGQPSSLDARTSRRRDFLDQTPFNGDETRYWEPSRSPLRCPSPSSRYGD